MAKRLSYTVESVERAFDVHKSGKRIDSWKRHPDMPDRWLVDTVIGRALLPFELRSLREAYIFVYALGTAAQATEK